MKNRNLMEKRKIASRNKNKKVQKISQDLARDHEFESKRNPNKGLKDQLEFLNRQGLQNPLKRLYINAEVISFTNHFWSFLLLVSLLVNILKFELRANIWQMLTPLLLKDTFLVVNFTHQVPTQFVFWFILVLIEFTLFHHFVGLWVFISKLLKIETTTITLSEMVLRVEKLLLKGMKDTQLNSNMWLSLKL